MTEVDIFDFDTKGVCHNMPPLKKDQPWYPFYGQDGESRGAAVEREEVAKSICHTCQVKDICLRFALERESSSRVNGVFGGKTEDERIEILRSRRLVDA